MQELNAENKMAFFNVHLPRYFQIPSDIAFTNTIVVKDMFYLNSETHRYTAAAHALGNTPFPLDL